VFLRTIGSLLMMAGLDHRVAGSSCDTAGVVCIPDTHTNMHYIWPKRNSATRFSTSGFFHESVSPKPLSILLVLLFQIFSKIRWDFCSSRWGEPPVSLTPVTNRKNLYLEKFSLSVWTLLGSRALI